MFTAQINTHADDCIKKLVQQAKVRKLELCLTLGAFQGRMMCMWDPCSTDITCRPGFEAAARSCA